MKSKIKRLFIFLGIAVLICFSFYMFYLPHAYLIKFKSELSPFSIYGFINESAIDKKEEGGILFITQLLKNESEEYANLFWEIDYDGDISNVRIKVIFTKEQWKEKIKILTFRSSLLDATFEKIKLIYKEMNDNLNSFRWSSPKDEQISESDCLCVNLESAINEKPRLMNQHVDRLAYYAKTIKNKSPRLYINAINFAEQRFSYEFCFPIDDKDKLGSISEEYYVKHQPNIETKAINFYGNFARTPQFWAKLYDSLRHENKQIRYPIVEEFIDSPFSGKNDTEWLSKIYFY
jgi:effector-binding domain-containing protein